MIMQADRSNDRQTGNESIKSLYGPFDDAAGGWGGGQLTVAVAN